MNERYQWEESRGGAEGISGGDIDNRETMHVWRQGACEKSVPSSQFCSQPKLLLKKKRKIASKEEIYMM